jgi:hypothetical protein
MTTGAAPAHLAVIGTVAKPAHPVAALNVAAWVEGALGWHPVLGVHLQAREVVSTEAMSAVKGAGSSIHAKQSEHRQASNSTRACLSST